MPFLKVTRYRLFRLNLWNSDSILYQDISVCVATQKNISVVTAGSQLALLDKLLVCSVCCVCDLMDGYYGFSY
jgi:hypothetical protein